MAKNPSPDSCLCIVYLWDALHLSWISSSIIVESECYLAPKCSLCVMFWNSDVKLLIALLYFFPSRCPCLKGHPAVLFPKHKTFCLIAHNHTDQQKWGSPIGYCRTLNLYSMLLWNCQNKASSLHKVNLSFKRERKSVGPNDAVIPGAPSFSDLKCSIACSVLWRKIKKTPYKYCEGIPDISGAGFMGACFPLLSDHWCLCWVQGIAKIFGKTCHSPTTTWVHTSQTISDLCLYLTVFWSSLPFPAFFTAWFIILWSMKNKLCTSCNSVFGQCFGQYF